MAPGAGMELVWWLLSYTENPSSCDQLLLSCSPVQKQWLWIQGALSDLDAPKDAHDSPPDTHSISMSWESLASPCPRAWAQLAALLPPRSREPHAHSLNCSCHLRISACWGRPCHQDSSSRMGGSNFSEPALGKATGNRDGSYSIPFLKGEEHLLILAPIVLCYKHLVQLLRAAWLSGELDAGLCFIPRPGKQRRARENSCFTGEWERKNSPSKE